MTPREKLLIEVTQRENNELKQTVAKLKNEIHNLRLTQFGMLQELYQARLSTFAKNFFHKPEQNLKNANDFVLLRSGIQNNLGGAK